MSSLLVKQPSPSPTGLVHVIDTECSDLKYVGFKTYKLHQGQYLNDKIDGQETCLVFIAGKGQVEVNGEDLGILGERMSPFEGLPWSVYIPGNMEWQVIAKTEVEIAICLASWQGQCKSPRVIQPNQTGRETRGKATNVRHVCNILPETEPADSLLVVEVITPSGHWSSYPPHKHDQDNLPEESLLEETYYHRLNPAQGFAFQRVYTDDRSLDETMTINDGDVVCVPKGYHPCGTPHGYELYYLNVMAGPKRVWKFHNDPNHQWILNA